LQERIKSTVLTLLTQHPDLFEKVNFMASLRSQTMGPFYQGVARALAETPNLPPPQLRYVIEASRRGKNYEQLERFAAMQETVLEGDKSPGAENLRAKRTYEQHMAAYQQAEAVREEKPDDAERLYQESLRLAEISAEHAKHAGDEAGEDFALMNIGGLLAPRMKDPSRGIAISEQLYAKAISKVEELPEGQEKDRYQRLAMNTCANRLPILVERRAPAAQVRQVLTDFQQNPLYPDCENHENVKAIVDEALQYLEQQEKTQA
jgi:hypothetical protein